MSANFIQLLNQWAEASGTRFVCRSHGLQTAATVSRDDLLQLVHAASAAEKAEPIGYITAAMLAEKDALLRQALEALEAVYPYTDQLVDYSSTASECPLNLLPANTCEAIEAIRQNLGVKND